MKSFVLSCMAVLTLVACACRLQRVTPDASPWPLDAAVGFDAAPLPEPGPFEPDDAWCPLAERTLIVLQCRDPYGRLMGAPNADNEKFAVQCRDLESKSMPMNAKCTAKAVNCEEAKKCTRSN